MTVASPQLARRTGETRPPACSPTTPPSNFATGQRSSGAERLTALVILIGFIVVIAGARAWKTVDSGVRVTTPSPEILAAGNARPSPFLPGIDPNIAPWWELSMLPQIGEGLAREIVSFRSSRPVRSDPVFRRAADLDQVRGIGPKTVHRVAPLLRFPPPPAESGPGSSG